MKKENDGAPPFQQKLTGKLKRNPFTAKMVEDFGFRTTVFAFVSFAVTVAFAVMNLASAILYRLLWYGAVAAYYFVLIFFRGGVILADYRCKKNSAGDPELYERRKWEIYRASGALLIVLEFAFAAAVTQMMLSDRPAESGVILAIANAAYAFYKMTMAIYNLVKAKRYRNPVTQTLRNLNFADACMSIVSLTVLLITTFDDGKNDSMTYVKALAGFAACAALIALAVYMIVKSNKELARRKREAGGGQN